MLLLNDGPKNPKTPGFGGVDPPPGRWGGDERRPGLCGLFLPSPPRRPSLPPPRGGFGGGRWNGLSAGLMWDVFGKDQCSTSDITESAQPLLLCRGEIRGRRGRRLAPFPALLSVEQIISTLAMFFVIASVVCQKFLNNDLVQLCGVKAASQKVPLSQLGGWISRGNCVAVHRKKSARDNRFGRWLKNGRRHRCRKPSGCWRLLALM